jgi:hypothetical protein
MSLVVGVSTNPLDGLDGLALGSSVTPSKFPLSTTRSIASRDETMT